MENNAQAAPRNASQRIAIIGAGAAGMLTAIRLREAGFDNIVIYEKADEVGGTWRENRYPGVACDVPAHHYNFSFAPNPGWHHRLAQGDEIQGYMKSVAEKYRLRPHIVFGQRVGGGRFDGACWHIETDGGLRDRVDFLVAATGPLHVPQYPAIDDRECFAGTSFHSACWPEGIDLRGKRVGIVGNGSSGVQIIASLAARGVDLTVFMRTPQWVFPLGNRAYGDWERRLTRSLPWIARLKGAVYQWFFEHVFAQAVIHDGWQRRFLAARCRSNLASVADADLRRRLTPPDRPMCKRMVMSADFYPAMQRPNVHLVQDAIARMAPEGPVTADGKLYPLDVLIYATGFWARSYCRPLALVNAQGIALDDVWQKKMGAHLSIHVPGFPNFMIVGGPHSPRGNFSAIAYSEAIVDHIVNIVSLARDRGLKSFAAKPEAMERFQQRNRAAVAETIWVTGCRSWYLDEHGEPENWTGTPDEFRTLMRRAPDLAEFDVAAA